MSTEMMSENEVSVDVELDKQDLPAFMVMVNQDNFAQAVEFGRKSRNKRTNAAAELLATGRFIRRRDNLRIPPQPGEESMVYFWYIFDTQGNKKAREWLESASRLATFKEAWDAGRAKKRDGSQLGAVVLKTSTRRTDQGEFAKAKARKQERAERDRAYRESMKTPSSGGGAQKRSRK